MNHPRGYEPSYLPPATGVETIHIPRVKTGKMEIFSNEWWMHIWPDMA